MYNYRRIFIWLSLVLIVGFSSCTNESKIVPKIDISSIAIDNSSNALIELIQKNGDYINAKHSPYLLDVSDVYYNSNDYLKLDLRSQDEYEKGHIDGAIRVERKNLLSYLKKNHPENFSKVILIDNTGFESAYAASILRAAGYSQVYPLKFGMAVWSNKFASAWTNNLKSVYSNKLETESNKKGKKNKLPKLNVKASTVPAILEERASKSLNEDFLIDVESIMQNPSDYYIVNYWPKNKYSEGHLPGAKNFKPKASLKMKANLLNLPTNKKIALYCYTGSSASAVVGYLRLLGYDAYSIKFGANSFMYNTLKAKKWHAFDIAEKGNNYPVTTGPKASSKKEVKSGAKSNTPPPAPVVKRKKKEAGGGGCD